MKKITIVGLCLLGILGACKKDDDAKKEDKSPVFTSLKIEGTEYINTTDEIHVHLGEAFDFTVSMADDKELSELQVEIHSAFDGHNHAKSLMPDEPLKFGPEIRMLTGQVDSKTFNVFSENDVHYTEGDYHLEMLVLDKAGNRTVKVVALHIENHDH